MVRVRIIGSSLSEAIAFHAREPLEWATAMLPSMQSYNYSQQANSGKSGVAAIKRAAKKRRNKKIAKQKGGA